MAATQMKLHMLNTITKDFSDDHKVGSGGFADVYWADHNGEKIAVKLLHATVEMNDQQFMNELRNHMRIQHPNVVRLVGYCYEQTNKYLQQGDGAPVFGRHIYRVLCSEYMEGKSLDNRLSENTLGDYWHTHYQIIKGTCEGLHYLHRKCNPQILHLDLKPANILLDHRTNPKIADFGLSRIYDASRSSLKVDSVGGTRRYMAPELIKQGEMSEMSDVFSLGVTILDVIKGYGLYHDVSDTNFVQDVRTYWESRDRTAHLEQVEACTKIAIRCVNHERKKRPRIDEIMANLNCIETQILNKVRTYWESRDRTAHLEQVEACTKIAIRCVNHERKKRPRIDEIMANLNCIETQILNKGLNALTVNSTSRRFSSLPGPSSARGPLDVVIVYAFDCSAWTPAWYAMDDEIFWLVQEKLAKFTDSCMGYIYVMLSGNTYTCDMKIVDSDETKATGYTGFARRRITCYENMAYGLSEAHKMINNRGYENGIILLFSNGVENKGDFFDGAENFESKVPVHTFTFDGDGYNHVLRSIAAKSPGGWFHTTTVPERPTLSPAFSKLLDNILGGTPKYDEKPPSPISGRGPLDVVMVYAFDCTESTPAWHTVDSDVFWLLQEKLTHFPDSCMGYIYVMSTPNTYTSDMKLVDPAETKATGYTGFARRRLDCTKNMASGLPEAHKMIRNRGDRNGIILFFSDGLVNKGDFFDGTENFYSKVPVHTFTLGGDTYNHGLQAIADKSLGGTFNPIPVPERPQLSRAFSKLLDRLLGGTVN